jgi:hypothetical protein
MSNLNVEAAEPDPAATSVANGGPVETEAPNNSVVSEKDTELTEAGETKANGEDKREDETENGKDKEVEAEKNGEATPRQNSKDRPRNGNNKGYQKKNYQKRENRSKYDPSKLEKSSDHEEIRNQVRRLT